MVHFHHTDILSVLVQKNCDSFFQNFTSEYHNAVLIEYQKPGAKLAASILSVIEQNQNVDIFLLKNHGIIVAGFSLEEIGHKIEKLEKYVDGSFQKINRTSSSVQSTSFEPPPHFRLAESHEVNSLAQRTEFINRVRFSWPLYPDHVVFLGQQALVVDNVDNEQISSANSRIIFVNGVGVLGKGGLSRAEEEQLLCFYDVIKNIPNDIELVTLTSLDISSLINWDKEKMRMDIALAKSQN